MNCVVLDKPLDLSEPSFHISKKGHCQSGTCLEGLQKTGNESAGEMQLGQLPHTVGATPSPSVPVVLCQPIAEGLSPAGSPLQHQVQDVSVSDRSSYACGADLRETYWDVQRPSGQWGRVCVQGQGAAAAGGSRRAGGCTQDVQNIERTSQ
jgi:hypothetical protein